MENDVPDEKREFDWSIVCLLFITANLKYILLEVCQNKNINIALRKCCLFLLLLTQGVDDKTFIGFGDLSNIKIYSVSPRISNSGYRPRRIFLVSTE